MIRVISLMDNLSASPNLKARHGLSVYVETPKHKILFDLGPDAAFSDNAEKLGIDLSKVDTVIISHGHYDHGGGIKTLLKVNPSAKIYIRRSAFEPYYTKVFGINKYIGLDRIAQTNPNIIYTEEICPIDDELTLFSGVTERKLFSKANSNLFAKQNHQLLPDCFDHEQYLIVHSEGKQILFTGCSHVGIVNIMEKFNQKYRSESDVTVIGGFHLYDLTKRKSETDETIFAVAEELQAAGDTYYTGHCTGEKVYEKMKTKMRDQLLYLAVGDEILLK